MEDIKKTFSAIMSEIADDLIVKLEPNTFHESKLIDRSKLEQGS